MEKPRDKLHRNRSEYWALCAFCSKRLTLISGYVVPCSINPQQLLTEARQDGPQFLGRLLQFYYNYLRLLASAQIGDKLQARVSPSDVVQETFLDAHRNFCRFRGQTEREFLAWLRRILTNNLARLVEQHVHAEKRDVRREVSIDQFGAVVEQSTARLNQMLADQAQSPSAIVAGRESAVILADKLAEMPPDYREVIVLRHVQALSFKEVADRIGRSPGAARMLWLRAIAHLRQQLVLEGLI